MSDGRELRVHWSNKLAPLENFILVDPSATSWVVKPDEDTGERLTAAFVENDKEPSTKVDFYVRTVFASSMIDAKGIRPFRFV
ncbi:MAG TPA: hypothetical protein VJZ75_10715 [Candidatus Bathyarchaeia archaeon]|nr:hypothetical protein [Candidatus Bathyarchaeia archaeon]